MKDQHIEKLPTSHYRLAGPPDLWAMKRAFQINFLKHAGLLPQHQLLDFGCGPQRGGVPLIEYLDPGCYTGMDVREVVLEEGRVQLAEIGLDVRKPRLVHCGNLPELELVHPPV